LFTETFKVTLGKGITFNGQMKDGVRHGKGVQVWEDGSRFEGEWVNDRACTSKGKLIHGNGDIYEGEWKDDKANGMGVYCHKDGAR